MAARSFLDTKVLIYADAGDERVKQKRALNLIAEHHASGTAVVSTQVLQEYVNVALRKLGLPHGLLRQRLAFYRRFDIVPATPELIASALDLHLLHSVSFYDALILQAAIVGGCHRLLSEDLQDGATLGGVRIVNPFRGRS